MAFSRSENKGVLSTEGRKSICAICCGPQHRSKLRRSELANSRVRQLIAKWTSGEERWPADNARRWPTFAHVASVAPASSHPLTNDTRPAWGLVGEPMAFSFTLRWPG